MTKKRAHVFISGRVQGVNFRYNTLHRAQALGLTGWVRNLYDGRVEAVFEGDEQAIHQALDWCHRGPSSARVEDVSVEWGEPNGSFQDFGVKPSGRA